VLASNEYLLIGTGERFVNTDGSSRQDELGRCQPGEVIRLKREPDNPRDPMAVALSSSRSVQIGYLGREDARWLAALIDAGRSMVAIVERVAPKGRPFSPLAVTMKISVSDE
jgi:single-stranded-DNA-specific exonuclease